MVFSKSEPEEMSLRDMVDVESEEDLVRLSSSLVLVSTRMRLECRHRAELCRYLSTNHRTMKMA